MIVESGLDVPNANTMIVHDAHRFGLAQLYQLRGRVGRSHRRAYCYLIVPDSIDPDAEERLKVLEHHTDLGAGYRIALKDLELRGAGNLLGAEQSGQAHAVGFDLYLRWLEETVQALRGQGGRETQPPPEVVLDRPAHLPDTFVADDDTKLDLYRRLARAETPGEIDELRSELRERFGPLPVGGRDAARHGPAPRAWAPHSGSSTSCIRGDEARLTFRAGVAPRMAKLSTALDDVQLVAEVRRTVPLALRLERLGGEASDAGAGAGAAGRWSEPGPLMTRTQIGDGMRRLLLVVSMVVLAGCNRDMFKAGAGVAAVAGSAKLSSERLADFVLEAKGAQLNNETADFITNVWVDYSLFAQAVAKNAGAHRFGHDRGGHVAADHRAQGHDVARLADGEADQRHARRGGPGLQRQRCPHLPARAVPLVGHR